MTGGRSLVGLDVSLDGGTVENLSPYKLEDLQQLFDATTATIYGLGRITVFVLRFDRRDLNLVSLLLAALRKAGISIFLDVDDNFFDPGYDDNTFRWIGEATAKKLIESWWANHPLRQIEPGWLVRNWHAVWEQHGPRVTAKIKEKMALGPLDSPAQLLPHADLLIVATERLADVVRTLAPATPLHVLANCIDPGDYKPVARPEDGKIRVAYYGWMTHSIDAHLILPALYECSRLPNVSIHFWGWHPNLYKGAEFPGAYTWEGIDYRYGGTFDNILEFHQAIGTLDVALAPLIDGEFNACKGSQKWAEAAMHSTPMIVSNSPAYACVENYKTGMVAKDALDFHLILKWLVGSEGARKSIGEGARAAVLERHTTAQWSEVWRQAIGVKELAAVCS